MAFYEPKIFVLAFCLDDELGSSDLKDGGLQGLQQPHWICAEQVRPF